MLKHKNSRLNKLFISSNSNNKQDKLLFNDNSNNKQMLKELLNNVDWLLSNKLQKINLL